MEVFLIAVKSFTGNATVPFLGLAIVINIVHFSLSWVENWLGIENTMFVRVFYALRWLSAALALWACVFSAVAWILSASLLALMWA